MLLPAQQASMQRCRCICSIQACFLQAKRQLSSAHSKLYLAGRCKDAQILRSIGVYTNCGHSGVTLNCSSQPCEPAYHSL